MFARKKIAKILSKKKLSSLIFEIIDAGGGGGDEHRVLYVSSHGFRAFTAVVNTEDQTKFVTTFFMFFSLCKILRFCLLRNFVWFAYH